MKKPTKEQIKDYLIYIEGIKNFSRIHGERIENRPIKQQENIEFVKDFLCDLSNSNKFVFRML